MKTDQRVEAFDAAKTRRPLVLSGRRGDALAGFTRNSVPVAATVAPVRNVSTNQPIQAHIRYIYVTLVRSTPTLAAPLLSALCKGIAVSISTIYDSSQIDSRRHTVDSFVNLIGSHERTLGARACARRWRKFHSQRAVACVV